jgi:hypothetical protein
MAVVEIKKKRYFKGDDLLIGKGNPFIEQAAPTDIIRVLFDDIPSIAVEFPKSALTTDAPDYRVKAYPLGAWEVPISSYKVVTA